MGLGLRVALVGSGVVGSVGLILTFLCFGISVNDGVSMFFFALWLLNLLCLLDFMHVVVC